MLKLNLIILYYIKVIGLIIFSFEGFFNVNDEFLKCRDLIDNIKQLLLFDMHFVKYTSKYLYKVQMISKKIYSLNIRSSKRLNKLSKRVD